MKSGWKNLESTIPVLVHSLLSSQWNRVCRAFCLNPCLVFFAVKFHFSLPDCTCTHLCRISKFLRRGVEFFLSGGLAFHEVILS